MLDGYIESYVAYFAAFYELQVHESLASRLARLKPTRRDRLNGSKTSALSSKATSVSLRPT